MQNERFPVPGSRFPTFAAAFVAGALVSAQVPPPDSYRSVAEQYVKLVLAVGQHDGDYVDAFYGPAEWRTEAEAAKKPLAEIDKQAAAVETELAGVVVKPAPADVEMWGLRRQYLSRQLASLRSRVAMLQGKRMTFDEESLALYDAVAPTKPVAENGAFASSFAMSKPALVPARREVWYSDGATGFHALRVAKAVWPRRAPCAAAFRVTPGCGGGRCVRVRTGVVMAAVR